MDSAERFRDIIVCGFLSDAQDMLTKAVLRAALQTRSYRYGVRKDGMSLICAATVEELHALKPHAPAPELGRERAN